MIHSVAISELVGTNYYTPLKGDLRECIKQASELGYEGVELHARSPNGMIGQPFVIMLIVWA